MSVFNVTDFLKQKVVCIGISIRKIPTQLEKIYYDTSQMLFHIVFYICLQYVLSIRYVLLNIIYENTRNLNYIPGHTLWVWDSAHQGSPSESACQESDLYNSPNGQEHVEDHLIPKSPNSDIEVIHYVHNRNCCLSAMKENVECINYKKKIIKKNILNTNMPLWLLLLAFKYLICYYFCCYIQNQWQFAQQALWSC